MRLMDGVRPKVRSNRSFWLLFGLSDYLDSVRTIVSELEKSITPDGWERTAPGVEHLVVSADMVLRLLQAFAKDDGDPLIIAFADQLTAELSHLRRARNHFAHWDERLTSGIFEGSKMISYGFNRHNMLQDVWIYGENFDLRLVRNLPLLLETELIDLTRDRPYTWITPSED